LGNNVSYDLDKFDGEFKYYKMMTWFVYFKIQNGICANYSTVSLLSAKCSIEAYTVGGYTRLNGKVETKISHAWNVARIDSNYYLFDPTWGAGYVRMNVFTKIYIQIFETKPIVLSWNICPMILSGNYCFIRFLTGLFKR